MKYLSIPALLFAASIASAQDMPLHEILKPGETWQSHSGDIPNADAKGHKALLDKVAKSGGGNVKEPTCCVVALGGSTLLVADAADRHVWAFRLEKDGTLGPADRYCRLQVRGDQRRTKSTPPEAYRADPSAMTIDNFGRAYVATNMGIQVYDPTGRLCGVFMSPPGRATKLAFDGDRLFAEVDGKAYMRKMLAEGRQD